MAAFVCVPRPEIKIGTFISQFIFAIFFASATVSAIMMLIIYRLMKKLFGEDRLVMALNKEGDAAPDELIGNVKDAIKEFVGKEPQFDDITMLAFRYNGKD